MFKIKSTVRTEHLEVHRDVRANGGEGYATSTGPARYAVRKSAAPPLDTLRANGSYIDTAKNKFNV